MAIIKLLISFDGTKYHGWQRQKQDMTVQQLIEEQLSIMSKTNIQLHGAGRTDAGVHAEGMVAHFETKHYISPLTAYVKGLNSMLPRDIRILKATKEPDNFHSRYSTTGKTYRYDFFTGAIQLPNTRLYTAHFPGKFNINLLTPAIKSLTGTHDFSSFEHTGSRDMSLQNGKGAVRTIYKIECVPQPVNTDCWSLRVTGDGFLRQMVRIIAGTLIEIGQENRLPDSIPNILEKKKRRSAGSTAPACGLFLEQIYYNDSFEDYL